MHTCLSPCAEEDMRPRAIVRRAKEQGLDVIGICDHNSARNVASVRRAAEDEGLAVLGGMEVTSEEEVHVLGLFDDEESLCAMQRLADENLAGENNPELFGDQFICDENDVVVGRETRLLIGATSLSLEQVVESIRGLGGLAVPSHVDRESFSILSQLGFVPSGLAIDALEVSPRCSPAEARERFPQVRGYPLVCSSDAHRPEEIGTASFTFTAESPCVVELRKALRGEDGREVMN